MGPTSPSAGRVDPATNGGAAGNREAPQAQANALLEQYRAIRKFSVELCKPLAPEDCVIQSMPDVSPTRWHLAHTTWFFETFVLAPRKAGFQPVSPQYEILFNSYYNSVGEQFPRAQRGLLSRPTVAEVLDYRRIVDERVERLLDDEDCIQQNPEIGRVVELGLQHEQQHQELMLTDIKHVFSCNPLVPAYKQRKKESAAETIPQRWLDYDEDLCWIGFDGPGFAFDNESPRHRVFVHARQLASRLVTCGEYLEFIEDGGYRRPQLWLSEGWAQAQQDGWQVPLYWRRQDDQWREFTLAGLQPLDLGAPVCHVSYFEADAFARWAGARLPTEAEWETAAEPLEVAGNFVESGRFHPVAASIENQGAPCQMFGDVWEWTASPYVAYPGYQPPAGALGEYNGKFMCNQFVLRGGSCATPQSHIRAAYRNFFPPAARWQFSGIRLAK